MAGTSSDARLGIAQLEARLGVSRRTIATWTRQGKLPRPHYIAGLRRWWLSEIEAWERENVTDRSSKRVAV